MESVCICVFVCQDYSMVTSKYVNGSYLLWFWFPGELLGWFESFLFLALEESFGWLMLVAELRNHLLQLCPKH